MTKPDDLWEEESGSPAGDKELSREWEARRSQFFNSGYREGLEEGKSVLIQQGFNAGFIEGSQAGFEYGLVRGALQTLSIYLSTPEAPAARAKQLHARLSGVTPKQAMARACLEILTQPLEMDDGGDERIASALRQLAIEQQQAAGPSSSAAQEPAQPGAAPAGSGAAADGLSVSWRRQVQEYRRELAEDLACDVGAAPQPPARPAAPSNSTQQQWVEPETTESRGESKGKDDVDDELGW